MTVYVRSFQNQERELLQALRGATSVPVQIVQRAKLVLRSAEKAEPVAIAQELKLSVARVKAWIARFNTAGLLGLFDRPRCGRPRLYSTEQSLRVVGIATTTPTTLQLPFQQWSLSHLRRHLKEEEVGQFCRETIRGILQEQGISYQKARTWEQCTDPNLASTQETITSCYVDPPDDALILCFDQKGPVQFRQQRGYHYQPQGKAVRVPEEYVRHGTGYLLAALHPHSGRVWGRCFQKYNSGTVLWFLGWLLRQLPADKQIIIIWDNASPHSQTVRDWLERRFKGRVRWLYTPVKASWLNLIEAWMSMFERDVIHNSNFESLVDFEKATRRYLDYYNAQCHPFRWGHKRQKRIYFVGPLRRTVLWGRACAASMSPRWALRLAKALIT
jgi:putative transposase